jgi:hypothetical protein
VVAVLSSDECAALVSDAEAYAAQWGWTTSRHTFSKVFSTQGLSLVNRLGHLLLRISVPSQKRHKTHATTDIPVQLLPEGGRIWNGTIAPRVQRAIASGFGFRPESVTPVDVFLVKYESREGGQRELSVHRDGALMTFSLLLNDPAEFTGGGTYFEESGRVYRPAQGVAVVHSGKLRHGGFPITGGTRYVLVGFCLVEHEKVTPELKDWRWGEPGWYLRYVFCPSRSAAAGCLCVCSCVCSWVRACLRTPEDAQLRWQVPSMHALYICQSIYYICLFLSIVSIDRSMGVCLCVPGSHAFYVCKPFVLVSRVCVCVCVCLCVCLFARFVCSRARMYVSALGWCGTQNCWTVYTIPTACGERQRQALQGLKLRTRKPNCAPGSRQRRARERKMTCRRDEVERVVPLLRELLLLREILLLRELLALRTPSIGKMRSVGMTCAGRGWGPEGAGWSFARERCARGCAWT